MKKEKKVHRLDKQMQLWWPLIRRCPKTPLLFYYLWTASLRNSLNFVHHSLFNIFAVHKSPTVFLKETTNEESQQQISTQQNLR
jgi:hypothetical protein